MNKLFQTLFVFFALVRGEAFAQEYYNHAADKPVRASVSAGDAAHVTDASLTTRAWRCNVTGREQWIEIDLTADFDLGGAHLYFDEVNAMPLESFVLQYDRDGKWADIEGGCVTGNFRSRLSLRFAATIGTSKVRLLTRNEVPFGIAEIQLWGPDVPGIPYGVSMRAEEPFRAEKHWVCVNQVAYNTGAPKRFTVPTATSDLRFEIVELGSDKVVWRGHLQDGVGDFTAFDPDGPVGKEYSIRVRGGGLKEGRSYPFEIGRHAIQRMSYRPAVWFMNDCRSVVGTHHSGYGGRAWRDGAYYTYEVPGMVMMYLSDTAFFNRMPVSLSWDAERQKVLDPAFCTTKERADRDVLNTVRNYYELLPCPSRQDVPDIIQDIRFGVGWILLDPISEDPSTGGDPAGERMHAQSVEQLAYFLYAWPAMKRYVDEDFYRLTLARVLRWWEPAGLFDVITTVGNGKGRNAPGHSVLPNLLMYEVSQRECPDMASRFLQAAQAQAEWCIRTLDWTNPAHTKGQRMSEAKTVLGLAHFYLNYPAEAPEGLREKLHALAERYVTLSDNMWDFRRFDLDANWTIPGFNEAGNIAGFPACALAVAMTLDSERDGKLRRRLEELAYAAFDNLYGRNPLNAHASNHPENGFEGVDNGWPYHYMKNVTARLETVRGSISSLPGTEMYPFNPKGRHRHPEGWTAYNAVWDMSLAWLNFWEGVAPVTVLREVR